MVPYRELGMRAGVEAPWSASRSAGGDKWAGGTMTDDRTFLDQAADLSGTPSWRLYLASVHEARARLVLVTKKIDESAPASIGGLVGPRCRYSTTLTSEHRWKPTTLPPGADPSLAAFDVDLWDPCLWEPAHPFLYEGSWAPGPGAPPVSLRVGLRQLTCRRQQLLLNGHPYFFRGLEIDFVRDANEDYFDLLHEWGCTLALCRNGQPHDLADRQGPFLIGWLPPEPEVAWGVMSRSGCRRPSIAVWLGEARPPEFYERARLEDPTSLLAAWADAGKPLPNVAADLLVIWGSEDEILASGRSATIPWIAACQSDDRAEPVATNDWPTLSKRLDERFQAVDGCVGWISGGAPHGR